MVTGVIVLLFVIGMIAAAENGEWGSVAIGAVIGVLLLALGAASRDNARAYNNAVRYWSDGGPDRRR